MQMKCWLTKKKKYKKWMKPKQSLTAPDKQ